MFGRRNKEDAAARAAMQEALAKVDELLADPAFQVLTPDRMHWINPFSGQALPTPFDYRDMAKRVLLQERPWERMRPRSLQQVLAIKWLIHLKTHIRHDDRLRLFHSDGRWLNPFTGNWVEDVHRVDGRVTAATLGDMARSLAACGRAQEEGAEMLPLAQLKRIYNDTMQAESAATEMLRRSELSLRGERKDGGGSAAGGAFGWTDLFGGDDSPFDPTPTHQQAAVVLGDVQPLLARGGLDWALHPGFEAGGTPYLAQMQATADGQILLLVVQFRGAVKGAADCVQRLRNELRVLCRERRGMLEMLRGLNDLALQRGKEHPLVGLIGLCAPEERSMDWIAAGSDPALAVVPGADVPLRALGGTCPSLGTLLWDDLRPQLNPTLVELERGMIVFAAHQELYKACNPVQEPIGGQSVWSEVLRHADKHPREIVSAVIQGFNAHCRRPMRTALPMAGMLALRVAK